MLPALPPSPESHPLAGTWRRKNRVLSVLVGASADAVAAPQASRALCCTWKLRCHPVSRHFLVSSKCGSAFSSPSHKAGCMRTKSPSLTRSTRAGICWCASRTKKCKSVASRSNAPPAPTGARAAMYLQQSPLPSSSAQPRRKLIGKPIVHFPATHFLLLKL